MDWVERNRDRLRQVGMSQSVTMQQTIPGAPPLESALVTAQELMQKRDEDLKLEELDTLLVPCGH